MKNCNNKNCGCQQGLTTPGVPLPDCPQAQPCSYVTDAQCVVYSDDDVLCDSVVVLETGTTLNNALQDIYDKLCSLLICDLSTVIFVSDDNPLSYELSVSVSGGSGTYSYSWSFSDSLGPVGFTTVTNLATVGIDLGVGTFRLVQVIVTDTVTNCKAKQLFIVLN
jgi:hypothetical protein